MVESEILKKWEKYLKDNNKKGIFERAQGTRRASIVNEYIKKRNTF